MSPSSPIDVQKIYELLLRVQEQIGDNAAQVGRIVEAQIHINRRLDLTEESHRALEAALKELEGHVANAKGNLDAALQSVKKIEHDYGRPLEELLADRTFWSGVQSRWKQIALLILMLLAAGGVLMAALGGPKAFIEEILRHL